MEASPLRGLLLWLSRVAKGLPTVLTAFSCSCSLTSMDTTHVILWLSPDKLLVLSAERLMKAECLSEQPPDGRGFSEFRGKPPSLPGLFSCQ